MTPIIDTLSRGASGVAAFPISIQEDLKVPYVTVATITDRNNIPAWKRIGYMTCYVVATNLEYTLGSDVTIAGQVWSTKAYGVPVDVLRYGDVFDISTGFIKSSLIGNIFLNSSYVVSSQAAMLALTTLVGNFIIRTDNSNVYVKLNNTNPALITDFAALTLPAGVISVNGQTGIVSITIANLLAVPQNTTDFNTAVSANTTVLGHSSSIATIQGQITTINSTLLLKADLVSGKVPLSQLPTIVASSLLNNYSATVAPTINEDGGDGYAIGSRWINTISKLAYVLVDSTLGAAIWVSDSSGGGTFLSLTDTPSTYVGASLQSVRVNVGETGLEFYSPAVFSLANGNGTTANGAAVDLGGTLSANVSINGGAGPYSFTLGAGTRVSSFVVNATTAITLNTQSVLTIAYTGLTHTIVVASTGFTYHGSHSFETSTFKIKNPAATFNYIFAGSAIAADRTITLPLLAGNDIMAVEGNVWKLASGGVLTGINTIGLGTNDINFTGTTANFNIATTTVASSTATQANSLVQSFQSSLWTGAAATPGWFSIRDTASTTNNQLHILTVYSSVGASPSFGTKQLELYSNGSAVLGGSGLYFGGVFPGSATGHVIETSSSDWYFRNYVAGKNILIGNGSSGILNVFWPTGEFSVGSQTKAATAYIFQPAMSSLWLPTAKYNPGAHTGLTAATEFPDFVYGGLSSDAITAASTRTATWLAGTVATQRSFYFKGTVLTGASATATFTNAYTVYIDAPTVGTNAAITAPYALGLNGGMIVSTINGQSTGAIKIVHTGAGVGNYAMLQLLNSSSSNGQLYYTSSTYSGADGVNALSLYNGTGDINIWPQSGNIRFLTGAGGTVNGFVTALGNMTLGPSGTNIAKLYLNQSALTTSNGLAVFRVDGGAHTNLTLSTELIDINYNLARTVQFATGTLATQRAVFYQGPTYAFVGSSTLTNAYTLFVSPPIQGTNATINGIWALGTSGNIWLNAANGKLVVGGGGSTGIADESGIGLRIGGIIGGGGWVIKLVDNGNATVYGTFSPGAGGKFAFGSTTLTNANYYLVQAAAASAWVPALRVDPGAHTNMTAATEFVSNDFQGTTQTWLAGTVARQRFNYFRGYTAAGASATATFTEVYTMWIDSPIQGTNANITSNLALGVSGNTLITNGTWTMLVSPASTVVTFSNTSTIQWTAGSGTITAAGLLTLSAGGGSIRLDQGTYSTSNEGIATINRTYSQTSGTGTTIGVHGTFAVASGTATFTTLLIDPTYNLTSTYVGLVYGIDYSPTLTAIIGTTHIAARFKSGQVLIGGTSVTNASVLLDLQSTTQALAVPRLTTAQITAIVTKSVGMVVYDTNLNQLQYYNNTAFTSVGGGSGWATTGNTSITGNTSQTGAFTNIFNLNGVAVNQNAQSGAANAYAFNVTGGAHTTLTLSTEFSDVVFNLARTVQFATGALALQRAIVIQAPTYSFVGASVLASAATSSVGGAPSGGSNATITSSHSFLLEARALSNVTNSYGLTANANTGATNNYSAQFQGGIGLIFRQTVQSTNHNFLDIIQADHTGGTPYGINYITGAVTNLTASAEAPDFLFQFNKTKQWATGPLARQYNIFINPGTLAFVGTSVVTNAALIGLIGAPNAGTNGTITHTSSIYVEGFSITGTVTNSYGIRVNAHTGATNNYSAQFIGGLGTLFDAVSFKQASPGSIGASQNNYNIGTQASIRLTASGAFNITGMTGGIDGRILVIMNIGANNIVFTNEDAASTAANRMTISTAGNLTIAPKGSVTFMYDATNSRWVDISVR